MSQKEPIWLKILRIALGLLFLFSSISKAVDPVNFGITMNDYFVSFGLPFLKPVALLAGVCAITCEFVLGCMMLFGVKTLLAAWGYLLFMVFFFFLTLWLAVAEYMEIKGIHYFGVVHDCGCFGQVVKMSNMTTFLKNVVIIIPTLIIFAKRKKLKDVRLTELGKWCCILLFIAIAVLFQVRCIRHLPAIDFSDWKKGDNVEKTFIERPAQKESLFIYRNNADQTEVQLTEEELMNQEESFYEQYEYVDRKDKVVAKAKKAEIDGFNMLDEKGADHAYEYINADSKTYLLFLHDLMDTKDEGVKKAISLAASCAEKDIPFVAVTNSEEDEIAVFVEEHGIEFPIYRNPIDPAHGPFMVRDAIRSNPGLIVIDKGVVTGKWAWRDMPQKAE